MGRVIVLVLLLVMAVVGPLMILSDTEPPWPVPWLRYVVAGAVGVVFLTWAAVYGACCVGGNISENERRRERRRVLERQ